MPGAEGKKQSLTHLRYYRAYLSFTAKTLLLAQLKAMCASPCTALLIDGSTDVSNEEHALIWLKHFVLLTLLRQTCFLCAVKLPGKAGSGVDGVVRSIFEVLELHAIRQACSDRH